jgi:hypothetical protein
MLLRAYIKFSLTSRVADLIIILYRKYRYMDQNHQQRRRGLEEKIPDIKKTLSMVEYLQERRVRIQSPRLFNH